MAASVAYVTTSSPSSIDVGTCLPLITADGDIPNHQALCQLPFNEEESFNASALPGESLEDCREGGADDSAGPSPAITHPASIANNDSSEEQNFSFDETTVDPGSTDFDCSPRSCSSSSPSSTSSSFQTSVTSSQSSVKTPKEKYFEASVDHGNSRALVLFDHLRPYRSLFEKAILEKDLREQHRSELTKVQLKANKRCDYVQKLSKRKVDEKAEKLRVNEELLQQAISRAESLKNEINLLKKNQKQANDHADRVIKANKDNFNNDLRAKDRKIKRLAEEVSRLTNGKSRDYQLSEAKAAYSAVKGQLRGAMDQYTALEAKVHYVVADLEENPAKLAGVGRLLESKDAMYQQQRAEAEECAKRLRVSEMRRIEEHEHEKVQYALLQNDLDRQRATNSDLEIRLESIMEAWKSINEMFDNKVLPEDVVDSINNHYETARKDNAFLIKKLNLKDLEIANLERSESQLKLEVSAHPRNIEDLTNRCKELKETARSLEHDVETANILKEDERYLVALKEEKIKAKNAEIAGLKHKLADLRTSILSKGSSDESNLRLAQQLFREVEELKSRLRRVSREKNEADQRIKAIEHYEDDKDARQETKQLAEIAHLSMEDQIRKLEMQLKVYIPVAEQEKLTKLGEMYNEMKNTAGTWRAIANERDELLRRTKEDRQIFGHMKDIDQEMKVLGVELWQAYKKLFDVALAEGCLHLSGKIAYERLQQKLGIFLKVKVDLQPSPESQIFIDDLRRAYASLDNVEQYVNGPAIVEKRNSPLGPELRAAKILYGQPVMPIRPAREIPHGLPDIEVMIGVPWANHQPQTLIQPPSGSEAFTNEPVRAPSGLPPPQHIQDHDAKQGPMGAPLGVRPPPGFEGLAAPQTPHIQARNLEALSNLALQLTDIDELPQDNSCTISPPQQDVQRLNGLLSRLAYPRMVVMGTSTRPRFQNIENLHVGGQSKPKVRLPPVADAADPFPDYVF